MSFLIIVLAALTLGEFALWGLRFRRVESYVFRLYTGFAICALIALTAGAFSLRAAEFLVFLAAVAGLLYQIARRFRAEKPHDGYEVRRDAKARTFEILIDPDDTAPHSPFTRLEWAAIAALIAANILTLVSALAPTTSWDAATAHLALPQEYAREGRIQLVEGNPYTAYPHLLHGLFAVAFVHGGELAVGMISWTFGLLACGAMFILGRRIGDRQTGLVAAAILASSPIYFDQAGNAALDLPFTGCALAALAAVTAWRSSEHRIGWLLLAGVLTGVACGIRHTGFVLLLLVAIGVALVASEKRFERSALYALSGGFAAYPWLLRSALLIGNPFYPFFQELLPTPYLPDMQTTLPGAHETVHGLPWTSIFTFPWDIVTRPDAFDGWQRSAGGLVLILGVPGAILCGKRARALGAFSLSGLAIFAGFQRFARYVFPFLAPLMVAAALTPQRMPVPFRRPVAVLIVASLVYGLILGGGMVHFKVSAALGLTPKQEYLAQRVERYAAFEWVNRNLDPHYAVFTLDPRTFYLDGPAYQNPAILPFLAKLPPQDLIAWFHQRRIRYLLYPKFYLDQSPALRARGYVDIVDAWRRDDSRFRLLNVMSVPRPGGGAERVEIYEILYSPRNEQGSSDEPA